jgi:hypothetical protein
MRIETEAVRHLQNFNREGLQYVNTMLTVLSREYSIEKRPVYEFSLSENNTRLKVLHLLFLDGLSPKQKKILYIERKEQIADVFSACGNCGFNVAILNKVLKSANSMEYPIQTAFEFYKSDLVKLKLYFSNSSKIAWGAGVQMLIKDIFGILGVPGKIRNNEILGEGIDSLGIDFLNTGGVRPKIYTYYQSKFDFAKIRSTITNQIEKFNVAASKIGDFFNKIYPLDYSFWGFLYRPSPDGEIVNIKAWYRLNDSIKYPYKNPVAEKLGVSFFVSYLTTDGENNSEYFRIKHPY